MKHRFLITGASTVAALALLPVSSAHADLETSQTCRTGAAGANVCMTITVSTAYSVSTGLVEFTCVVLAPGAVNVGVNCGPSGAVPASGSGVGGAVATGFAAVGTSPDVCADATAIFPGPVLSPGLSDGLCVGARLTRLP